MVVSRSYSLFAKLQIVGVKPTWASAKKAQMDDWVTGVIHLSVLACLDQGPDMLSQLAEIQNMYLSQIKIYPNKILELMLDLQSKYLWNELHPAS